MKCKRCNEEVKESDPDVESVSVRQNQCSHFVHELYHRECLYKDHIDSLESRVKDIESAWQDAELRADKNLSRVEELEATLKTLAAQAMYAAGYTKKGDWKNES